MSETNKAIAFINSQALIVTAIFGLFGSALVNFLGIPELKLKYISIAYLLGFVIILLLKFLLKTRNTIKVKIILKVTSVILFVGLIISFFSFNKTFDNVTFKYKNVDDSSALLYIKGSSQGLQKASKFFIEGWEKRHGEYPSDQDLIDNFGGIDQITHVWKQESITENSRNLITNYMIMAMLFVANIYFLTEILLNFYKKNQKQKITN